MLHRGASQHPRTCAVAGSIPLNTLFLAMARRAPLFYDALRHKKHDEPRRGERHAANGIQGLSVHQACSKHRRIHDLCATSHGYRHADTGPLRQHSLRRGDFGNGHGCLYCRRRMLRTRIRATCR